MTSFSLTNFANHRKELRDKSVSENDDIFCNPILWIAKNVIVFAYRFVPIIVVVNCKIIHFIGNTESIIASRRGGVLSLVSYFNYLRCGGIYTPALLGGTPDGAIGGAPAAG